MSYESTTDDVTLTGLVIESTHATQQWARQKADNYLRLLRHALWRSLVLYLIPIGLCVAGLALKYNWLLSLGMLLFGFLAVGLMVIAAPILTGVAAAARAFPSFRLVVSGLGACSLYFLIMAMVFVFLPINMVTVLIVPACAAILGAIWFFTGNRQSLTLITKKISLLLLLTVLSPTLAHFFPQTAGKFSTFNRALDQRVADVVASAGVTAASPHRLEIDSLAEFRDTRFFHPTNPGESLVWYYRNADGEIELFSAPGNHPSTGQPLTPVTPKIVAELHRKLARGERKQADEPVPRSRTDEPPPKVSASPEAPGVGASVAVIPERRQDIELAQQGKQQALSRVESSYQAELRAIDSRYRWTRASADRSAFAAQEALVRRRESESLELGNRCMPERPGLESTGQGPCEQEQRMVEARYRQGLAAVAAERNATVRSALEARTQQMQIAASRLAAAQRGSQ